MIEFLRKLQSRSVARAEYWKTVRGTSLLILYAGVFSLFCCFGFVILTMQTTKLSLGEALFVALTSGGFAVGYAATGFSRRYGYLAIVLVCHIATIRLLRYLYSAPGPHFESDSALNQQLHLLGLGAIFALTLAWALFITFFSREGTRYFRAQTEIELAAEIHRTLVPVIHKTIGRFEIYGASLPSGQVGGDLVDVAEDGDTWMAYIADVSGHGVPSGVLMAMFKTAVRVLGVADPSSSVLLEKINGALLPLTMPNMFVTAALLQCYHGDQLSASLAGHPPLLHYSKRSRTVSELPSQSVPLGIIPAVAFAADSVAHEPGDIFLLLTDGLTEVFDAEGNELGMEPIKSALSGHAAEPLPQLFQHLRQVALGFGRQEDDQTMLLVRQIG